VFQYFALAVKACTSPTPTVHLPPGHAGSFDHGRNTLICTRRQRQVEQAVCSSLCQFHHLIVKFLEVGSRVVRALNVRVHCKKLIQLLLFICSNLYSVPKISSINLTCLLFVLEMHTITPFDVELSHLVGRITQHWKVAFPQVLLMGFIRFNHSTSHRGKPQCGIPLTPAFQLTFCFDFPGNARYHFSISFRDLPELPGGPSTASNKTFAKCQSSIFTGWMSFLMPIQHQSTEDITTKFITDTLTVYAI